MDLIFLIKSIMNKKLFSWKALAGLALLVAMGLTSCKQGTEVDPNDPYNTTKPVTPGSTTKGSANVTITVVAGTDLVTEYDKWVATLNADQKKAIADAKEFTIGVNAKGYKLDGVALTLPKVWANPTDKTLNVVFTNGFAEAKKALIIDADKNNTNANVNITLPAGEFALDLVAAGGRPTIKSEAGTTVSTLSGTVPAGDKNLLTIGDGVTVKVLDLAAQTVKTAGTGNAVAVKLAAGTYTGEDDGTIKSNGLKFKNLEVAAAITVQGKAGDKKLALENVHIAGANTLTIGGNVASIANISGDLTSAKALQANVVSDAIVGKLSKVILAAATAGKTIEIKDGSALDNVQIKDLVKASANIGSISGVIFDKQVTINFDKSNVDFAFNGVKFGSTIKVEGKVESETVNTYETWSYSVATGWSKKAADDPSVAVNDKIAKWDTTNGYFVDANGNKVVPEEDVVRFKVGSTTLTTLPENTSITLDAATVTANKIDGSNITALFGGNQTVNPGYKVIANDATYIWKETIDSGITRYQLRKQ